MPCCIAEAYIGGITMPPDVYTGGGWVPANAPSGERRPGGGGGWPNSILLVSGAPLDDDEPAASGPPAKGPGAAESTPGPMKLV